MFSVPTLTIGDVAIVVRPILSAEQLRTTTDAISRIKGVDRVIVDRLDHDTAHLQAHTALPVALASEIRGVLHRNVASCTVQHDAIVVDLVDAHRPGPDARGARQERVVRDRSVPGLDADGFDGLPTDLATMAALNGLDEFTILLFDREQRYTACAGGLHRRFGHEFALMQGRRAADVIAAPVWAQVAHAYRAALTGASTTVDVVAQDGTVTETVVRPLRDDHEVVGGMAIARDVTEQRRTQRALREVSAVLEVTFDRADRPYALLSPEGRWVRVNAAMQRLLDASEAALVCETITDRTHPDDHASDHARLADLATGRRERSTAVRRLRSGDRWLTVPTDLTAIRSDGRLSGLVLTVRAD